METDSPILKNEKVLYNRNDYGDHMQADSFISLPLSTAATGRKSDDNRDV